jgi:hypothetical protein
MNPWEALKQASHRVLALENRALESIRARWPATAEFCKFLSVEVVKGPAGACGGCGLELP